MTRIPHDPLPESSIAMLVEGYKFPANRRRMLKSDIFKTRVMLQEATVIVGEAAAEFFYSGDRFTRKGALPPTTLRLLHSKSSVQQLDGEPFRHRNALFMSFMTPERIVDLIDRFNEQWESRLQTWIGQDEVILHDEVQHILCRAVCAWAGIPMAEPSATLRTREFAASVEAAGAIGPRMLWGLLMRANNERWCRSVISAIRADSPRLPEESPAYAIAWHRDLGGSLLDLKTAAIELNNLLRPTVAVARFIAYAALALHTFPRYRDRAATDDQALEHFVQEVRRYYPFLPVMGGRALRDLDWNGHHFPENSWVLLDGYGTNHSREIWGDPQVFRPERFRDWNGSPYNFIPQGGGDFHADHRCPAEWITIDLMKAAVRQLLLGMRYEVPEQDLSIDLGQMPAAPQSRFVISKVQPLRQGTRRRDAAEAK